MMIVRKGVAVLVMAGVALGPAGCGAGDAVPAGLADALAVQVTPIVESRAVDRSRLACAVQVFGVEPESATTVGEVRTAYVWTNCATLGTEVRSEFAIPMAVRLDPPAVSQPGDGSDFSPDIDRIFPERVRDHAYDGVPARLESAMQDRVRALS